MTGKKDTGTYDEQITGMLSHFGNLTLNSLLQAFQQNINTVKNTKPLVK